MSFCPYWLYNQFRCIWNLRSRGRKKSSGERIKSSVTTYVVRYKSIKSSSKSSITTYVCLILKWYSQWEEGSSCYLCSTLWVLVKDSWSFFFPCHFFPSLILGVKGLYIALSLVRSMNVYCVECVDDMLPRNWNEKRNQQRFFCVNSVYWLL